MTSGRPLVHAVGDHGLLSVGNQLITYQCHHHSLFLDQTVSDALGGEGWAVRRQAAFEASHALLSSVYADFGIEDPPARIEKAAELFEAMGHGRLTFEITAEGGTVRGHDLHYGTGFVRKYTGVIRNRRPVDTFAAGFVAAAASLAFPSDWGVLEADELGCVARGDDLCVFALTRRPERPRFGVVVTRPLVEQVPRAFAGDVSPSTPAAMRAAEALTRLLDRSSAEQPPLQSMGVPTAVVPVSYTNQITYDTAHLIEKRSPELVSLVLALVREAAQTGAFHLLGHILASPAWQAQHGPPSGDLGVRLEQMLGLARALGWGSFSLGGFTPKRSLVLRSPMTHESAYYATRHGATVRGRLFFQQGLAIALMRLVHGVEFSKDAPMGPGAYQALVQGPTRFIVQETRSPLRGDPQCEVTVEADGE